MSVDRSILSGRAIPGSDWSEVWEGVNSPSGDWTVHEWYDAGYDDDMDMHIAAQEWTFDGRVIRVVYGWEDGDYIGDNTMDEDEWFKGHILTMREETEA